MVNGRYNAMDKTYVPCKNLEDNCIQTPHKNINITAKITYDFHKKTAFYFFTKKDFSQRSKGDTILYKPYTL